MPIFFLRTPREIQDEMKRIARGHCGIQLRTKLKGRKRRAAGSEQIRTQQKQRKRRATVNGVVRHIRKKTLKQVFLERLKRRRG